MAIPRTSLPNLRLNPSLLAGLARPGFSDSVGKSVGAAVSAPEERRKKGMLTDLLALLADPAATSADYATAARGLIPIDQELGMRVAARGRTLAEQEEAKRLSQEEKTTQRGLQGGLAAITQASMRGIPLSDLTEATGSILGLGGTNQQIIDAYEAGKTDPSEKFSVVGNRVFDNTLEKFVELPEAAELLPLGTLEKVATPESVIKYAQTRDPSDLVPKSEDGPADRSVVTDLLSTDTVLGTIDKALGLTGEYWSVGYDLVSKAPFPTDTREMAGYVKTLQANLAFDRLQDMRDRSKTGGALGQVSNIELGLLQSSVAALDPGSKNFEEQLATVRRQYENFRESLLGRDPADPKYQREGGVLYYDLDGEWIDLNEAAKQGRFDLKSLDNRTGGSI